MFKCALKLLLLFITFVNSVSIGYDDIALMTDMLPKTAIIKLPRVSLPSGVVDVLNVNKYGDFFQCRLLVINKQTNHNTFDNLNCVPLIDQLV